MYAVTSPEQRVLLQSTLTRYRSSSEEKEPDDDEDEQIICSTGVS
jgi:hypothetical protein